MSRAWGGALMGGAAMYLAVHCGLAAARHADVGFAAFAAAFVALYVATLVWAAQEAPR